MAISSVTKNRKYHFPIFMSHQKKIARQGQEPEVGWVLDFQVTILIIRFLPTYPTAYYLSAESPDHRTQKAD